MFTKSWNEMRKFDVTQYCDHREEKDKGKTVQIPYLNWAKCVQLLHENGAEVVLMEPMVNEHGSSLFMTEQVFTDKYDVTHRCYEVRVKITIDDIVYIQNYPLMNGINPVKDNSINQLRINNAQQRAFVKGVAIRTGLGFGLWVDGDETDRAAQKDFNDYSDQDIKKYYNKIAELVTEKINGGADVVGALGYDDADGLRADITSCCQRLMKIEKAAMQL